MGLLWVEECPGGLLTNQRCHWQLTVAGEEENFLKWSLVGCPWFGKYPDLHAHANNPFRVGYTRKDLGVEGKYIGKRKGLVRGEWSKNKGQQWVSDCDQMCICIKLSKNKSLRKEDTVLLERWTSS